MNPPIGFKPANERRNTNILGLSGSQLADLVAINHHYGPTGIISLYTSAEHDGPKYHRRHYVLRITTPKSPTTVMVDVLVYVDIVQLNEVTEVSRTTIIERKQP